MRRLAWQTGRGPRTRGTTALYRVMKKFLSCVKQSHDPKHPRKDCGWWYGERSLTGLFAAAAWLLSKRDGYGWSLEEFTSERTRGKRQAARGRGDLWLLIGKNKVTIEAKVTWPEQLDDVSKWVGRVNTKLKKAFGQLRNLDTDYHYGRPAAVCYVVPAIPRRKRTLRDQNPSKSMRRFIQAMTKDDPRTAVAACWLKDLRQAPYDWWKDRRHRICYLYPGVAAVVRYKNRWRFSKNHG